jgi:hypothetical protein
MEKLRSYFRKLRGICQRQPETDPNSGLSKKSK